MNISVIDERIWIMLEPNSKLKKKLPTGVIEQFLSVHYILFNNIQYLHIFFYNENVVFCMGLILTTIQIS